jgi:hypothetical protein
VGESLAEDLRVGDGGGIEFVLEVVEDKAGEGEAALADGVGGEEGVVEGAEAVGDDEEDGEIEGGSEVGDGFIGGEGDLPAADAFDEDEVELGGEGLVSGMDSGEVDGAVGELGGGEGGDGGGVEDGVDEGEVGAGGRGVESGGLAEGDGVIAVAAGDGFEAGGVVSGVAEGFDEEAGEVGFTDVGVGAGDEVAHGEATLCEALKVGK